MKEWLKELCPEISEWQVDLIVDQHESEVAILNQKLRVSEQTVDRCKSVADATAEYWREDIEVKDALLREAINTIRYYASVCGEDDQLTPAKITIEAIRKHLEGK